jgi:hypothetical protein
MPPREGGRERIDHLTGAVVGNGYSSSGAEDVAMNEKRAWTMGLRWAPGSA